MLILVSALLLTLYQTHQLAQLENIAGELARPLSLPLHRLGSGARNLAQGIRDWQVLRRRNEELEELVDALMVENVRLAEAGYEESLRRQELELQKANPNLNLRSTLVIGSELPAKVVGRDPLNLFHSLWIDQGANAGLELGMPVVTRRGLVGRIVYVGSNWARVLLVIDPRSYVNVLIQRSLSTGILSGSPTGALTMRMIPHQEEVRAGDLVLTSGLGGSFPKGLVVGQVVIVEDKDYEAYKEAGVRPTVNFEALEVVSVVVGFTPPHFEEEESLLLAP